MSTIGSDFSTSDQMSFSVERWFRMHPESRISYILLVAAAALVACAVMTGKFGYDLDLFLRGFGPIGVGLLACCLGRARGLERICAPVEMTFVLTGTIFFMAFGSVVAASSAAPLADPWLRAMDVTAFGFDRDVFVAWVGMSPVSVKIFQWLYMSLCWTPQLLFVLFAALGQQKRGWALLNALLIVLVVSVASLALVPAYGSPPYEYRFTEILDGVRDGSIRRFDDNVITGLVTFPSMHAAYGVVLARASALIGRWAIPLTVVNAAMVVSAIVVGGHYLIDLVAGCLLALIAVRVARLR